jgi:protein DJ-1
MKQTAPKRTADGIMLPRTDRDDLDDVLPAPRAIVLLAEGAEEIEVVVPIDILRRGGVEVVLAGLSQSGGPVRCGRGVVILPGGLKGAERLAASTDVGRLLRTQVEQMGLVAAICAAPIALVRHQVFQGRAMTCHPSVKEIVGAFGALRGEATLVEDGELITASGAGASFSFALTVLRRLQGEGSLPAVTAPMTFDHTPELPPYLQP